jgi:holin-like protein
LYRKQALPHLTGLLLLLGFLFLGGLITEIGHLPIPGSVVGMVLLTVTLRLGLVPLSAVRPTAELLVRHMAFLFVPPGVGLMLYFGLLRAEWMAIGVAGLVGTVAVLLVVGLLQQRAESSG